MLTPMSPLVYVAGFCLAMALIALGRVTIAGAREPNDVASVPAAFGVTLLAVVWVSFDISWFTTIQRVFLVVCAVSLVGVGALVLGLEWGVASTSHDSERSCRETTQNCERGRNF